MATKSLSLRDASVLAATVAFLVYVNTLDCGLVFDDEPAIKWNNDLRPNAPWSNLLVHDFWGTSMENPTSHKSYRPLCVATFRLNYLLHDLQPMGYHLVNVLLHSAVCYLYVQLCGVLFSEVWPALIAGLLFAVHPIHTEAVAGLVGRAELLSALFFISSFLVYRRAVLCKGISRMYFWVFSSLILSVFSMLSKEQGITVVAVCLIYDFCIANEMTVSSTLKLWEDLQSKELKKPPLWLRRFLKRAAMVLALSLPALVLRILISNGAPSQRVFNRLTNPPTVMESPYRQLSWLYLTFVNSWLLLNPSRLCADWRFGAVSLVRSLTDPHNLLTILTLASAATVTLYGLTGSRRRHKITLFGMILITLPFIPASNLFFPVGFVVAERVLYMPSMGFCILVAFGAWKLSTLKGTHRFGAVLNKFGKFVVCYLLLSHSCKTLLRNRDWHSSTSIHTAGIQFNPQSGIMLSNLGIDHVLAKNFTFAEHLYRTSMELAPYYSTGFYNFGKLMKVTERYQEAEEPLLKAIELGNYDAASTKVAETYNLLVTVVSKNASRLEEALSVCESALQLHPNYAKLHATKGLLLLKLNRTEGAVNASLAALKHNAGLANAHYNLGLAHMKLGNQQQAERAFRDVLLIDRASTHAMFHLATVLQTSGETQDLEEAKNIWMKVVAMEPTNTEALNNLAQVQYELSEYESSMSVLQRALQISPASQEPLLYRMASILCFNLNKYGEAEAILRRLLELSPNYSNAASFLHYAHKKQVEHMSQ